ncbi:MAG: hypothetical protein LBG92_02415 [Prevotellaceae bacterium]|nr:hypothetical protein [Prevotellaceae bacterium]
MGALAVACFLNFRYAINDYGVIDNEQHACVLAQSNSSSGGGTSGGDSSGGGTTGGGDTSGGGTSGDSGEKKVSLKQEITADYQTIIHFSNYPVPKDVRTTGIKKTVVCLGNGTIPCTSSSELLNTQVTLIDCNNNHTH